MNAVDEDAIAQTFCRVIQESGVSEFKWEKLRQARERFAALEILDKVIDLSLQGKLRTDILIWDTYDRRHQIPGRDDVANLQRMYYHVFKNVLQCRWPSESTWKFCPDENTALD